MAALEKAPISPAPLRTVNTQLSSVRSDVIEITPFLPAKGVPTPDTTITIGEDPDVLTIISPITPQSNLVAFYSVMSERLTAAVERDVQEGRREAVPALPTPSENLIPIFAASDGHLSEETMEKMRRELSSNTEVDPVEQIDAIVYSQGFRRQPKRFPLRVPDTESLNKDTIKPLRQTFREYAPAVVQAIKKVVDFLEGDAIRTQLTTSQIQRWQDGMYKIYGGAFEQWQKKSRCHRSYWNNW